LRIVLCENGLRGRDGHHFNLAASLREELAARGIPLALLVHADAEAMVRVELEANAVFRASPYDDVPAVANPRRLIEACLRSAWAFQAGLRRARIRPGDVVMIATARPAETLGIAIWSWTQRTRPAAVVMNFMTDDPATYPTGRIFPFLYRLGTLLTRLRLGDDVLLMTETPALAAAMTKVVHAPVVPFPLIKTYPPLGGSADGSSPTIAFLGQTRPDKGAALLPEVVQRCATAHPDARVVVQLRDDAAQAPAGGWRANVETLPIALDRGRYLELLHRAEVVVLPYDRQTFGLKASGIFTEAVGCAAVTVVPAQTWMAEMLAGGRAAGVTFEEFSADTIVDAVGRAIAELIPLREQALARCESWRTEHSAPTFVDRLLRALAVSHVPAGLARG